MGNEFYYHLVLRSMLFPIELAFIINALKGEIFLLWHY